MTSSKKWNWVRNMLLVIGLSLIFAGGAMAEETIT